MPVFRVRVTRTVIIKEEGWLEVEADSDHQANDTAGKQAEEYSDSVEFGKEWLDSCYYTAEDAELIKE